MEHDENRAEEITDAQWTHARQAVADTLGALWWPGVPSPHRDELAAAPLVVLLARYHEGERSIELFEAMDKCKMDD